MFVFSACNNSNEQAQTMLNQFIVTANGDTLESGFWVYDNEVTGVYKSGAYKDGYKTGNWIYKTSDDSVTITWSVVSKNSVRLNIPSYLKTLNEVEPPVLYQADIEDGDDNTYLALLSYNLTKLNSSVYGYLYQYNESWKKNTEEVLEWKEFKKFYFNGIEIYRAKLITKRQVSYEAISYVFVVKEILYDLTYKNTLDKSSPINLEIFNDILYSIKCENIDLFNFNNNQYLKEENIEFKNE